jgi:hypothetical protein
LLPYCNKLECLQLPFTSTLVKYLWARLEPTRVEPLIGLHSNGRLLALPRNITLGYKKMKVANTLAYCDRATITALKIFIVQTLGTDVVSN